jgi:hypothetical protein
MSVAELRLHAGARTSGPLHAVVAKREVRESSSLCDVTFADDTGAVLAEMIGVETVLRPGGPVVAVHDVPPVA